MWEVMNWILATLFRTTIKIIRTKRFKQEPYDHYQKLSDHKNCLESGISLILIVGRMKTNREEHKQGNVDLSLPFGI
jgi:hypothetical protein